MFVPVGDAFVMIAFVGFHPTLYSPSPLETRTEQKHIDKTVLSMQRCVTSVYAGGSLKIESLVNYRHGLLLSFVRRKSFLKFDKNRSASAVTLMVSIASCPSQGWDKPGTSWDNGCGQMQLNRAAVIITPLSRNVAVPANAKSPSSGLFAKDSETVLCRVAFCPVEVVEILGLDHVQSGGIESLQAAR